MATHPDIEYARSVMHYIDFGVPIYFKGPSLNHVKKNWNSCIDLSVAVESNIQSEVRKGRKIGPFLSQPN